jgi:hypothetical protein
MLVLKEFARFLRRAEWIGLDGVDESRGDEAKCGSILPRRLGGLRTGSRILLRRSSTRRCAAFLSWSSY